MVRVGGGWVDLDSYLIEYIGKRRRTSSNVEVNDYEFLEVEGGRSVSALGVYSSPPRGGGRNSGRMSAMEIRRSVSPMELRRSVSPCFTEDGNSSVGFGSIGRAGGTRRMFVRRK
jgi:hypothetical protein